MGSLYKTSAISPQDYMYQLPADMMLKVLDFNEGQIDNVYNTSDLFNKSLLNIKSLLPDNEDVNRIQKDYGNRIDEITKELGKDVTQWRKYRQPLQSLGREIQQDFSTGEIGRIQKNYELYQEYDKTLAELVKNKSISPMTARIYKAKALNDFGKTGFDRTTNAGNTFNGVTPMADIDLNKRIGDYVDKIMADENITYNSTVGKWYITDGVNGTKQLTEEKLLSAILPKIMGDQELLGYLNERSQVGMLNGIFNEDGNLNIFNLVDRMKDGKQLKDNEGNVLQKIDYYQNPLAKAVQGTVNERKYFSTQQGTKNTTANPYTVQSINHSQQWAMQKDRQKYETEVREQEKKEKAAKDEMDKQLKLADEYRKLGMNDEAAKILNSVSGNYPIVVERPNEKAFSPLELQNLAKEYTNLINNPSQGASSDARLGELQKIFGPAAKRLNIGSKVIDGVNYSEEQRYADALAFANGDMKNFVDSPKVVKFGEFPQTAHGKKVNRDAEGRLTNLNARGIAAQNLAKEISKNNKNNTEGINGVFTELSNNMEQQGQPELALDPNTKIGMVGLNLMDMMLVKQPFNIYLDNVAHTDGKGNLKPSNAQVKDIISNAVKGGQKLSNSFTEVSFKPEGNRGVYTGKMKGEDDEVIDVKIVVDGVNESLLPYFNDPKFLENPGAKEFAMYSDPYMYNLGTQVRSRMPYVDMGVEQNIEVGGKPAYKIKLGEGGYEISTENGTIKTVDGQPLTKELIPIVIRQLETNK